MKLVTHLLDSDGVTQELVCPENMSMIAVRPHLVKFNNPSGSLQIKILDADDNELAESETIDIADVGTLAYFHGYVRFYINYGLVKDTTYKIKLEGTDGYSFNTSSYIGWANGYDLGKYDPEYTPTNDLFEPLDLEIWKRKFKV